MREQLADLSSHFLVVLCAIYLEKYLLTLTGFLAFKILIPVACLAYILNVLFDWRGSGSWPESWPPSACSSS